MITDAIKSAETKPVVYFLLTAYVETLGVKNGYGIPEKVKHLPIGNEADVKRRSDAMHDVLHAPMPDPHAIPVIEETVEVFDAASEQLEKL
jgi:hypothetical protein